MSKQDKYTYGRWSAGLQSFGTGASEVVIGAVLDDNDDGPELRAVGRWKLARDMQPDLGALMDRAIRTPIEGRPHLPAVVRTINVENGEDIQSVRPEVRVEVGPTPALASELARLHKELGSPESWRWLEAGVTPQATAALFDAARGFAEYSWPLHDPSQLIRVSRPGAPVCSVMVASEPSATGGEVLTVAIAPGPTARDAWADDLVPDDEIDVYFYERDDLPDAAWEELKAHGWPATEDDLYPRVVGGGELERPATADEVALATDVLLAVGRFYREGLSVPEEFEGRANASIELRPGVAVDVSVDPDDVLDMDDDDDDVLSDEDDELLAVQEAEDEDFLEIDDEGPWTPAPPPAPATVRAAPKPGRNDECWCGSGKKYKKCHLDEDAAKARA